MAKDPCAGILAKRMGQSKQAGVREVWTGRRGVSERDGVRHAALASRLREQAGLHWGVDCDSKPASLRRRLVGKPRAGKLAACPTQNTGKLAVYPTTVFYPAFAIAPISVFGHDVALEFPARQAGLYQAGFFCGRGDYSVVGGVLFLAAEKPEKYVGQIGRLSVRLSAGRGGLVWDDALTTISVVNKDRALSSR